MIGVTRFDRALALVVVLLGAAAGPIACRCHAALSVGADSADGGAP